MIGDMFGNMLGRKPGAIGCSDSERLSHEIADSVPVMIWMSGPEQSCNYFNKCWLEFTGHNLQEEMGDGWLDAVHPDDRKQCWRLHHQALEEHREFSIVHRLRRSDGEYRWVLNHGTPRFDLQARFSGFTGSCQDITEQKRMETLSLAETRFRALFDSDLIPLCFWHENGRIIDANDAYLELTGCSRDDLAAGRLRCERLAASEDARRTKGITNSEMAGAYRS